MPAGTDDVQKRRILAGQISGWKARAAKIRAHSCPFVVQKHPQRRPGSTDLGLESPSYKNSPPFVSIRGSKTPAAKTRQGRSRAGKPELQKFVHIRVHSWFKNTRSEDPSAQIASWKARAAKIRAHSCPFVAQKHPQRRPCSTDLGLESTSCKNSCPFVSIRGSKTPAAKTQQDRSRAGKPELQKFVPIRVHSWFKNTRSEDPSAQISGWKARAEKIRTHSCPFVVQKHPQRRPFSTDREPESPSCKNSCPFVSIRGSKTRAAKTLQYRSRADARAAAGRVGRAGELPNNVDWISARVCRTLCGSESPGGARTVLHSRFCRNPT